MMAMKLQGPCKLVALLLTLISTALSGFAITPSMPFSKGTTWIYEGGVAWQEGTEVKSRRISLVTEIIESYRYPKARVAVVRGFPSELAWYGDKRRPGFSLLILSRNGLFVIETNNEQEANQLAQDFAHPSRELMLRSHTLIPFPLSGGRRFRSRIKGFRPSQAVMSYRDIYRTNPDHTFIHFVPGLGVIRYLYQHHGTVSFADVKLKEIRHGGLSDVSARSQEAKRMHAPNPKQREKREPAAAPPGLEEYAQEFSKAPKSEDYPAGKRFAGTPAPVVLSSKRARMFRTVLGEGAKQGPDFAGHYTLVAWGCGLGAFSMAVVDAQTGQVFFPPFDCVDLSDFGLPIVDKGDNPAFKIESKLFVFYGSTDEGQSTGWHFYALNKGRFKRVYFIRERKKPS